MKKSNKKINIVPSGDRVLIKPDLVETGVSVGKVKIVLPDEVSNEKSDRGTVLAVGEGRFEDGKLVPMRIKVGDRVIFSKYSYDEIKMGEDNLYLVRAENILALIK